MTEQAGPRPSYRRIMRSSVRAMSTIAVLTAIYFLLPLDRASAAVAVTILLIGLAALIALVAYQVRSVMLSAFPVLRAIESLATSIPLFLFLFAGTYMAMENISDKSFNQALTHIDALYFTVTVFATVGFGDITPTTEAARLVVTVQMIADLVIIGIAIRAIGTAVQRSRQRV